MKTFGPVSQTNLNTCDPRLQTLFNSVLQEVDCSILCGHRNEADQTKAFKSGASKVQWPNSKHNTLPSVAADVMPYPIDWYDKDRVTAFYEVVKRHADKLGLKIRWGADWNMNGKYWERSEWEIDGPHYELVE